MDPVRFARIAATVGAAGMVVGGTLALGTAAASWKAAGAGTGNAAATSAVDLTTLDASALAPAELYPGGTGDVIVRLSNPNPFPLDVDRIDGSGAITSDAGAACDASTGVTFDDRQGLALVVPAQSTLTVTLPDAASMDATSHDACQGAVFTIPVTIG